LKHSNVKAWPISINDDRVKCLLLDSGKKQQKVEEHEEISYEAGDIFIGEGSV